jgi:hypothetical protein
MSCATHRGTVHASVTAVVPFATLSRATLLPHANTSHSPYSATRDVGTQLGAYCPTTAPVARSSTNTVPLEPPTTTVVEFAERRVEHGGGGTPR